MTIKIPELSLVALVGVSGSGKSTFAARHFLPTEVLSSDFCRGLVSDDVNSQAATDAAFEVLYFIAGKRLDAGRLTVVDATNVQVGGAGAASSDWPRSITSSLWPSSSTCRRGSAPSRNASRPERQFGAHVLRNQQSQLRRSIGGLRREGFHRVFVLSGTEEIESSELRTRASLERPTRRLWPVRHHR